MEVLNVPEDKEELVTLALEDVLKTKGNVIDYSTKYFPKRASLLVCFTHQQDKEQLRHLVKKLKVDDAVYDVNWTKMENFPSGDHSCPANLVEVLDVTDQDLVCEHFRHVLGKQPSYEFEEKKNRLILYLQSDEELSRVLEVERPDVDEHGPVHVMPVVESSQFADQDAFVLRQDKKYCVEVLGATDQDFVMEYITSLIKRAPNYQYFAESSRIVLTLDSQAECDQLLSKNDHYVKDLEGTLSFRKLSSSSKGLKVSGIPSTVSEKFLNSYFKNEENGGGAIKKMEWDAASGIATIFYNEDEVAERVFKKPRHQIRATALTLEMIEDSIVDAKSKTLGVLVRGIAKEVSKTYLTSYFSKDSNGGGAIRKLDWDPVSGIATIFFCDSNVAKTVASKSHRFRNVESVIQLIEEEENAIRDDTEGLPGSEADARDSLPELISSTVLKADCETATAASSAASGAPDREVRCCLVVFSDSPNVGQIESNIRKTWQAHDGEYELQFNPSECVGIVQITTMAGMLDRTLKSPQKTGVVFEKCHGETKSLLGDVHLLIEQISAETSREAVWSWLMVVTRCPAHTIYYSDILPNNSRKAVALISFHEGLRLDTSVVEASDDQYSIDTRTLYARVIRSPLKLMYVGISKKSETFIKQELQQLLEPDGCDADRVEDVELVGELAIVTLSSNKAFRKLLMHTSRLGCSSVLPYYDQLGCISTTHVVDYDALATKIKDDSWTSDMKRFVRPRLVVTMSGGRLSEDTLRKFFADRSTSGGDKSATLRSNSDGSFVVTFDDPQAADRVYQKYQNEGLKLGPCSLSLSIRGMRETSNSSGNQILVRNIGLASEDSLKFILWALAGTYVSRLTFVRDPQDDTLCAVARFQRTIDRYRLAYYCETATLDGNRLDIEPIPQPTALVLRNVPSDADKQLVKYCCEPDNVADCVEQDNGTWIIYFKSPEYAAEALGNELLYDDTIKLSAEPFSEYRVETNAREKGKRGMHQIRCNGASLHIVNFIKEWNRREFDNLIKETGAICELAEDGHVLIRLSGSLTPDHVRFVEEKFRSFMNKYEFWQVDVLPDIWNDLVSSRELVEIQRQEKSVLHVEALDVCQSKSVCCIVLTGHSSAVQNARQKVEQAIRFISDERERQKQRTSHTEILSPWTAKLLVVNDVRRKLQDKYSDLVVVIDDTCGTCYLEGFPSDIKSSLDHISGVAASIVHESFDVSVHVTRFLERETVVSHVNAKLLSENLVPGTLWFLPRGCVVEVYGLHAEQVRKAVQLIRAEIFENDIVLGESINSVVSNEKWKDCTDAICGRRNGDVIISEDLDAGLLHVICKASDSPAVLEEINNFTRRNLIKTTFMKLPRIVMQLLSSTFSSDILGMEKGQSRNHVRLSPRLSDSGEYGFHIEGNADGIINIQRIINDFLYKQQKVVTKQHVVCQRGAESFFNNRPSALRTIGVKSTTFVEVHDPNSVVESSREDSTCEFPLPGGVVVSVKKTCITDLECDVIVNPSNGELQHIGGLAAHIAKLGGSDLVTECDEYVRKNGKLPEGQACITSAGKGQLRCKKVVHAVGPRWQGGDRSEVNKLFQAIQNSLFHVEQHQLTSVALPPIGSGIFGYPLEKCTNTIVESVMSYCEQKKGSLSKVILVDVNDDGVLYFQRALNRQLGKESEHDPTESRPRSNNKDRAHVHSQLSDPDSNSQTSQRLAVAFQDVSVEVLREDICSQQADVIVSTVGQDLQLSKGFLSQLILKAAGNGMEQELKKNYSSPMKKGDFAITDGYRLNCRKVYHVCCPGFDRNEDGTQIQDIALRILKKVNEQKLSSIVFPAIGTGNLGHPVESVAEQLYLAVQLFVESTRRPVLTKVKFVLVNDELFQVFQACHRAFISGKIQPKLSTANTGREAAFLYEELNSKTATEGLLETVPAIQGDSKDHKKFTVNDISIEVVQGDITDEKTTIIVNCSDNQLNLDGQVSKAICRKGGPRIAEECRRRKSIESIRNTGIFLQSAGNLDCHYILHVNARMSHHDIVTTCLRHAEDQEADSIAFPAIGTGVKGSNAVDVAPALIESLLDFINHGHAQYLKNIRFVILDEHIFRDFQRILDASLSPKKQSFLSKIGSTFKSLWQGDSSSTFISSDLRKNRTEIVSLDDVENLDDIEEAASEVVLNVCGSETNIEAAIRLIEQLCASELRVRRITEEPDVIAQLTDHEVQKYIKFGNLLGVSVVVQPAHQVITLQSMDDSALSKVNENILTSLHAHKVSFLGKKVSDLDENYSQMLEDQCSKLAQWQYRSTNSSKWSNYPKVLNRKLEQTLTNKQPSLMYGPSTNRFFVDLVKYVDSSATKLDEGVTVRRRDPNNRLPEEWDSTDEEYREVLLDAKKHDFKEVEKEFMSTLGGRHTKILQITRVQNPTMFLQYIHQRERIASTMLPMSNNPIERRLWHGTSEAAVQFICRSGFNRSYSGKNNTLYGEGVYFARDSVMAAQDMYSQPNAAKEKYVILSLVLTGDYDIGTKNMRVPDKKPGMALCNYDTTVDNYDNPTVFVTYNDCQAYPYYVIKFI